MVCNAELGPAIAAGINIGSSNGSSTPAPNSPTSSRRSLSVENDSGDSDYEDVVDDAKDRDVPTCPVPHDQGKETINAIIPCNIDQLFTMIFTKSKFYFDFNTSRKTFDIIQSEWSKSADGQNTRTVTSTVTLNNLMGPKHCFVTETQIMHPVSTPGLMYVVDTDTVNAGVPYADSFYISNHFCLSSISANESRLIIINHLKFRKSVWGVKNLIEKSSWEGINDYYGNMVKAMKEECSKSDFIGDLPKPKAGSARRRRSRTLKAPAPLLTDIPRKTSIISTSMPTGGMVQMHNTQSLQSHQSSENSLVLKVLLSVLAGLLLLNGLLFLKMGSLESMANSPAILSHPFVLPKEIPESHQEWLTLLQHQESLHRLELQKWHEIISSALHILNQAESGLESLKVHISSSYPPIWKSTDESTLNAKVFDSVQGKSNSSVIPKPLSPGKISL